MNSDEDIKLDRAKKALETLRQEVKKVFTIAPNLKEIHSLEELPEEKAKIVEDQLWSIFTYGEYYVEKVMSDLSGPLLSVKNKRPFGYYEKIYKPFSKKIRELIDVKNAPMRENVELAIVEKILPHIMHLPTDIDQCMDDYEYLWWDGWLQNHIRENHSLDFNEYNRLKISFEKIYNFAGSCFELALMEKHRSENHKEKMEHVKIEIEIECSDKWERDLALYLSNVEKTIGMPYFKPDDWKTNKKDVPSAFVTKPVKNIPMRIRNRADEIQSSFIFGNWMSVIALSRCLLEYVIVERKSLLGIEVYRDKNKKLIRPLTELAADTEKTFPQLKKSMEKIIKTGNKIMHPPIKKEVLVVFPLHYKKNALDCMVGIQEIIGTLYSK